MAGIIDRNAIKNILNKCRAYGIRLDKNDDSALRDVVNDAATEYYSDHHEDFALRCIECLQKIFKAFIDCDGRIEKDVRTLIEYLAVATKSNAETKELNARKKGLKKIIEYYKDPWELRSEQDNLSMIGKFIEKSIEYIDKIVSYLQTKGGEHCLETAEYLKDVKTRLEKLSVVDGAYTPYIGNCLWAVKRELEAMNDDVGKSVINKSYMATKKKNVENLLSEAEDVAEMTIKDASKAVKNKFELSKYKESETMKDNNQGIFKNNVGETAEALKRNVDLVNLCIAEEERKETVASQKNLDNLTRIKSRLEEAIGAISAFRERGDEYAEPTYDILRKIVTTTTEIEASIKKKEFLAIINEFLKPLEGKVAELGKEMERPQKPVGRRGVDGQYVLRAKASEDYEAIAGEGRKRDEYKEKINAIKSELNEIAQSIHDPEIDEVESELNELIAKREKIVDDYDQGLISEDAANAKLEGIIDEIDLLESGLQERRNVEAYVREALGTLRKTCYLAFTRIDSVLKAASKRDFYALSEVANMALEGIRELLQERNPNKARVNTLKKTLDNLVANMENQMNGILGENGVERIVNGTWQPTHVVSRAERTTNDQPKKSAVKDLLKKRDEGSADGTRRPTVSVAAESARRRQDANSDDTGF